MPSYRRNLSILRFWYPQETYNKSFSLYNCTVTNKTIHYILEPVHGHGQEAIILQLCGFELLYKTPRTCPYSKHLPEPLAWVK